MRYAFVFVSILALWLAMIGLILTGKVDGLFIYVTTLALTLVLYWVGFRSKRR